MNGKLQAAAGDASPTGSRRSSLDALTTGPLLPHAAATFLLIWGITFTSTNDILQLTVFFFRSLAPNTHYFYLTGRDHARWNIRSSVIHLPRLHTRVHFAYFFLFPPFTHHKPAIDSWHLIFIPSIPIAFPSLIKVPHLAVSDCVLNEQHYSILCDRSLCDHHDP